MKRLSVLMVACVAVIALTVVIPQPAGAVQGLCSNCHTMHNSQDGAVVSSTGPHAYLLNDTCIGCHTGTNNGTNAKPFVMSTSPPTYGTDGTAGDTLAGGNFYWVATAGGGTDADGHNVDLIANEDSTLHNTPPGGTGALSQQLTCAGTYGCHGDRTISGNMAAIKGAHHSDATGTLTTANTVGNSYRFLLGIYGIEDSDYEYQPTSTAHNQYYGVNRTSEADATNTISHFCAECHGDFHNGTGNLQPTSNTSFGTPWLRHPTDFDLSSATGTEYGNYGGASHTYDVAVPVGSNNLSNGVVSTVFQNTDDAIVTCISCHRAHGSPNADLLRWAYTMQAGDGGTTNNGCFACHSGKH